MKKFIPIIVLLVPLSSFAVVYNQLNISNQTPLIINEVDLNGCSEAYSSIGHPLIAPSGSATFPISNTLTNCKSISFYQYNSDSSQSTLLANCAFPPSPPTDFGASGAGAVCVSISGSTTFTCAVTPFCSIK